MRRALLLLALVTLLVGACSESGESDDTTGVSEPGADTSPPAAASDTQPESSPPTAPDPREAEPEAEPVPPASEPEAAGPPDDADAAAVAVVRAWSTALNAGDNESAGQLFAPNAIIIQGPNTLRLPDARAATRFTASLPCSGQIVDVRVNSSVVTTVFELGHRQESQCDAPPRARWSRLTSSLKTEASSSGSRCRSLTRALVRAAPSSTPRQ